MEALGIQDPESELGDTGSDHDSGISPPFPGLGSAESAGDVIDAEIVEDGETESAPDSAVPVASRARRDRVKDSGSTRQSRDAKSGPPSLDEWTRFFSSVLLRLGTEFYINAAFRGIDEDIISERDVERLAMTDEERNMIAVPFAELSNKSKFMRKHGRMIVASGDSLNALIVLGMWASRVNRVAAKYRPKVVRGRVNGSSGQGTTEANGAPATGAFGGRIPDGFFGPIVPGSG